MANARFQDVPLAPQASDGAAELVLEFAQVVTAPVAQFDPLQVAPDALVGVHVWGIAGQGFEVEALSRAVAQEVLDDLAAVNRCAIPEDQELAREVAQQVPEEPYDIGTFEGASPDVEEQAPVRSECADGREVVTRERDGQDRGLPFGRVGADPGRQEVETRFIDPDNRPSFFPGFFSRTGQCSVSQASTLAGSRCVARTSGCWTLRPRVRRRRLTCEG